MSSVRIEYEHDMEGASSQLKKELLSKGLLVVSKYTNSRTPSVKLVDGTRITGHGAIREWLETVNSPAQPTG